MSFQPNPTAHRFTPAQDTLANMPSGTAFAQQARAAELKAARARRKASDKAIIEEEEVPERGPVSLGEFKVLTRRGARGGRKHHKSAGTSTIAEELENSESSSPSRGASPLPPPQPQPLLDAKPQPSPKVSHAHPEPQHLRILQRQQQAAQQITTGVAWPGEGYDARMPERTGHVKQPSVVKAYSEFLQRQAIKANERAQTPQLPHHLQYSPPPESEASVATSERHSDIYAQPSYSRYLQPDANRLDAYTGFPFSTPASSHTSRESGIPTQLAPMGNEMYKSRQVSLQSDKGNYQPPAGGGHRAFSGTQYR